MREIKFRGQTRKKGEKVRIDGTPVDGNWVYGGVRQGKGDFSIIYENETYDKRVVYTDTVCRYTGLKDKNGKEIWENDIVCFQFDNDNCTLPYTDTKKRYGKIFFSDYRASFAIAMGRNGSKSMNNDLYKYVQCGNRVEVIGNIFDNPELLERGGK